MNGWYKRQRNIPERPWFKDAKVLQLFDYLESVAYVIDGSFDGITVRRGSCPTTRPDMMEATGLSYKEVDRCLRVLRSYGEIIVKGYCRFSVITVCGYDSYATSDSLFGTTEGTATGTTEGTTEGTAHLLTIEDKNKDNLITPYSPYKNEREKEELALEIKKRYNKTFDGKLQPCIRLTMPTKMMVIECVNRFGSQSVDLVFQQVLSEPFSLGQNKTGFIASFQYIFTPKRFQEYLERAQLRIKKQQESRPESRPSVGVIEEPQQTQRKSKEEYEREMREYALQHPDSRAARIVADWDSNKQAIQQ